MVYTIFYMLHAIHGSCIDWLNKVSRCWLPTFARVLSLARRGIRKLNIQFVLHERPPRPTSHEVGDMPTITRPLMLRLTEIRRRYMPEITCERRRRHTQTHTHFHEISTTTHDLLFDVLPHARATAHQLWLGMYQTDVQI